ncbi:hypothetical protein COLO4_12593 [Corchorus olitorius]|uniref:Protein kinase domain-containing protein n=1 Tax=Corchorus olitorius TaxID=93759 RepID=A0A1R3K0F6_9ROSI|nr:hypothetical protein COLO4_12593 [Corchorus olitorius]
MPSRFSPPEIAAETPPLHHRHNHINSHLLPPLLAGAIAVTIILLTVLTIFIYRKLYRNRTAPSESPSHRHCRRFSYSVLRRATSSFAPSNRLGHGGFGSVYKGTLPFSPQPLAIKVMNSTDSLQGEREFHNELSLSRALDSPHIVPLIGFSSDSRRRRSPESCVLRVLDSETSQAVSPEIGMEKASVLSEGFFDKDPVGGSESGRVKDYVMEWIGNEIKKDRPKNEWLASPSSVDNINENGFSGEFKIGRRNSQDWASGDIPKSGGISSTPSMRGTVCYIAPEYGGGGLLSEKCDVYSFGVLVLVIISGRRPLQVTASPMSEFERANLISWARQLAHNGRLLELVDPSIHSLDKDQALLCITIALLCLQRSPSKRPNMKEIVEMLSGEAEPPHLPFEFSPSPPSNFLFKSRRKAR